MTIAEPRDYDVAIVGLGPVGATAALFLAVAGLRVAVVERERAIYPLPRAVALDGEVVRAFQGLGRAEGLCALLQTLRPGDRAGFANSRREWLLERSGIYPIGWSRRTNVSNQRHRQCCHQIWRDHRAAVRRSNAEYASRQSLWCYYRAGGNSL